MDRVFVTGDTHGLMDFNKLKVFCGSRNLDRGDYVIIAGDCGVLWSQELKSEYISEFEGLGVTILFVDGNHENFDMLKSMPEMELFGGRVHKISDNIYHLMRGEVFSICGKKILALGGGESNDTSGRIEHKTWWADERISKEDYDNAVANLSKYNNKVDIVISHMPPTKILPLIEEDLTCCGEELPWYIVPKLIPRISNEYLQNIADVVECDKWFYGHIHLDNKFGKFISIYDRIIELK